MKLHAPRLDFLTRRSASRASIALLVAGCTFAAIAVHDDANHSDETEHLNAELRHAKKVLQRSELRAKGDTGPVVEGNVPANWPPRLLTPWGELFRTLEQAQTDEVALLSIEPDAARGRLRLAGEAKNVEALADYLKRLQATTSIDGLRILMQQIKQNDPQQPIEFAIEAHWNDRRHAEQAS